MTSRPALLTPQELPKEIPRYRRVWRTATVEIILMLISVGIVLLITLVTKNRINLSDTQRHGVGVALALLPLGLWYGVSYRAERRARQPRSGLLFVLVLTMLVANAIGVPLVDRIFVVDEWLPNADALTRILGYTLTVGFSAEFLKFAVLRFSVWPEQFNRRIDGVAYSIVAALGYATVLNINFALNEAADPSAVVLRVAGVTLSQVAIGTIIGLLLAELRLTRPAPFWLPVGLAIAALSHGIYTAFRAGVIVAGFGPPTDRAGAATGNVPVAGLGIAVALVVIIFGVVSFLINSADARARRSPEFSR